MRFTIPGRLPGMNEIIAANRRHRMAGATLKREAETQVSLGIQAAHCKPLSGAVAVHLHWVEPNARRDPDNIRAGVKFILDALQSHGLIEGDGQAVVVRLSDSFAVDKTDPRVEVEVTGV